MHWIMHRMRGFILTHKRSHAARDSDMQSPSSFGGVFEHEPCQRDGSEHVHVEQCLVVFDSAVGKFAVKGSRCVVHQDVNLITETI